MMFTCSFLAVSVELNLLPFYNYTNGSTQVLKSTDEVFTQQQEESRRSSMDVTFFFNKSMNVGKKKKCPFETIFIFAESRKVKNY